MITFLNILLIGLLILICIEDIKEREISLIVIVVLIILGGFLNYRHHIVELFLVSCLVNSLIVLLIVFILWGYSKFKLQKPLFEVFGVGDLLFFVFLAVSFPTTTFAVMFVGSLLFSLLISVLFKKRISKWVPLAGLQALFTALIFGINQIIPVVNLYTI
jgi:Flp pilus assembly protein protease CpaA